MRTDVEREVTRKTLAGARWILILNVAATPFSFLTNTLLARISPLALGYYGAVMLFSAAFQTVLMLGGSRVFTRLLPALPRERRFPFLVSYTLLATGLFLGGAALALLVAPDAVRSLLERFGGPSPGLAVTFGVEVLLGIFLGHFLWASLHGPSAAVASRLPVAGFFLAALLALGPLRATVAADPSRYLWISAAVVFGVTFLVSAACVAATPEYRAAAPFRFELPRGFWNAAVFTQLETIVVFTYLHVAPMFVLLWLDVAALAPLYAALRYVTIVDGVSATLTSLLAPGLATLDAWGQRDDAVRQARAALRAAMLFLTPAAIAVMCFAPDLMGIFGATFRAEAGLLRIVAIAIVMGPVIHFGGGILVAFGAYRMYLLASLVYVAGAAGLLFLVVPRYGLVGAAWCATATALMNAIAVTLALRFRAGVRLPGRVGAALLVTAGAALAVWRIEPGRASGALLWLAFTGVFALAARVTWAEARGWIERLRRHDESPSTGHGSV